MTIEELNSLSDEQLEALKERIDDLLYERAKALGISPQELMDHLLGLEPIETSFIRMAIKQA